MKLPAFIRKWTDKLLAIEGDPIEAEKTMVSSIQKLVGVHNVCGDKENESMYFWACYQCSVPCLESGTIMISLCYLSVRKSPPSELNGISYLCFPHLASLLIRTRQARIALFWRVYRFFTKHFWCLNYGMHGSTQPQSKHFRRVPGKFVNMKRKNLRTRQKH